MLTRYARDDHLKSIMEPFLREFVNILTYGDEFSKISDSTYSFSSDGTMSYNISDKHRNSLLNV
jgi:hypothetical protein